MDFSIISTYNKCMQLNKTKIVFIVIGVWIVLISLLILASGMLLGNSTIQNTVLNKAGLSCETINLKTNFDLRFNLNISANKIKIFDRDKKNCFMVLENPSIAIKPIPLLFKRVNIKKFNSDNILITIKRDVNGNTDLLSALKINTDNFQKFKIKKIKSNISNFDLIFEDKYIIDSKTKVSLQNSDIRISKSSFYIKEQGSVETIINSQAPQSSRLDMEISSKPNSKAYNFNVDFKDINLFSLTDIAKKYISNDIKSVSGTANLNIKSEDTNKLSLNIDNFGLTYSDKTINPYKKVDVNADFITKDKNIIINDFDVLSKDLSAKIKGEISNLFSDKTNIKLETEIKDTQIANLVYFLPDDLIYYNLKGIKILKQSNFHGIVNGKTNLKLFPLDMTGSMKVENVHIPSFPKSSHQNDVTLVFMKDKMRVYTRVYTPDDEYVTIDGISNLDDSLYGKYSVKSTNKINLQFAQLYLVPIQQIIGFNIGPVPIMDIKGFGNIDIKTQGTVKDAQIFGQFSAYNASARIHGLDADLINGDCKLIFDNRNLIFKEIKGTLEGAKFLLTGIGNTKGEVDLTAVVQNAYLSKLFKTFNNSVLTQSYTNLSKNISALSGLSNVKVNLKGTIKDYETEDFLNNLALNGNIEFKNNKICLNNGLSVKNLFGIFNFSENNGQEGNFDFNINNSKFNTAFHSKTPLSKIASGSDFDVNVSLNCTKCAFSDILKEFKKYENIIKDFSDIDFYSKISLNIDGKMSINTIDLNNFKSKGYIVGLNSSKNKNISFEKGFIKIDNNNISFDNFKALFSAGQITAKGSSNSGLRISLNNISLDRFDKLLPKIKLKNSTIKSGEIFLQKDNLKLNAINIDYNKMPLVINLSSKINSKTDNFEADFSTILNETTTDYIINSYLSYPLKVKGEVPVKGKFWGNIQNYSIDFKTTVPKDSDISFSGANLGDTAQDREISGKINVSSGILSLNNIKLIKKIKNQNNKINSVPSITINGKLIQKGNNFIYDNFKIITTNPVNVRTLNLIFKKSILKKGNFECNLNLNGNIQAPKILGNIDFQDLDIPLYDTQINDIKVNISQKYINANVEAKNKNSDIRCLISAENDLTLPFVINKININSNNLNIQEIIQSVPQQTSKTDISEKQDFSFKPSDIIVKDGAFDFEDVVFDKVNMKNLKGNFSYKNNVFDLKNIIFDIANGQINASGTYSINTTKLNLKAQMKDCDANILAKKFLNLKEQIFGKMTGTIDLSAKHLDTPDGIKNVESSVNFEIDKGKMPKLGSLEYLLRAGNLLRNGILGLSLNNLIQVLTPYKTGEFEKISGSLNIVKGEVKNLQVFSKGKNLSMYLFGEYNILNNFADIQLYGRLSQNVSTALGTVGNVSIKQFINSFSRKTDENKHAHIKEYLDKIPLVDSSDQGGYFSAKVYGDINKDNYIKKFSWE